MDGSRKIRIFATAMKKIILTLLLTAACMTATQAQVMKKEGDGTYIVNTTTLAEDVEGYKGSTPVEIYIKKNKIVKVVLLKNQETLKYNARIKKELLPKYVNQKVSKKKTIEVDGVTGATFTSLSVIENVKRGLAYYWTNK